jgi:hypothetical protein
MNSQIKAKITLFVISTVWGHLILMTLPLMLLCLAYGKLINQKIDWLYSVFLGQDYYVSAILGNHHQTTVSALIGYLAMNGSKTAILVEKVVNLLFKLARKEENHCRNAMRDTDVYQFSARRGLTGFTFYAISNVAVIYLVVGLVLNINTQ